MNKARLELPAISCPVCGHKNARLREYCEVCSAVVRGQKTQSLPLETKHRRAIILPRVLMFIILTLIIYIIFKSF